MVNTRSNIKILDCTLRDGGYVNDFYFGRNNMQKIINGLKSAKIDLIEIGFLKNGVFSQDQSLFNYITEAEFLTANASNQEFCLMIRPDWYDIDKLESCSGRITNLRIAFRQQDFSMALEYAAIARQKGYKVFLNPVNILGYEEKDLESMIIALNKFRPAGVNIVDTFGSMLPDDLERVFPKFDAFDKDISIGLHLHENLSISLALACMFVEMVGNRSAYIDSSILGMGRIPGNLCTELIANYLNKKLGKNYDLVEIYKLIDDPISEIKSRIPWGYMPAYALTGFNQIDRTYAEYLLEQPGMSLDKINTTLLRIKASGKHKAFDMNVLMESLK